MNQLSYKIGTILTGKITGIQPYGAFVSLDDKHQGLIHVSEVKHGFIKNIEDELAVDQLVTVQIIDIDEYTQKISLSLRVLQQSLQPTPFTRKRYFTNKYKKIGFKTIDDQLDDWIDDALEDAMKNN